MEREIKFRAKRLNSREWVYGDYLHHATLPAIMDKSGSLIGIIPETVGQFTGVTDTAGQEIFESDLIELKNQIFPVHYDDARFVYGEYPDDEGLSDVLNCVRVGNIFDNPELLEQ